MNDLDYFALLLIKELKNKAMEIQIIVIDKTQVDFDMKLEILLSIWMGFSCKIFTWKAHFLFTFGYFLCSIELGK